MKTTTRHGASNAPTTNATKCIASMSASEIQMPASDMTTPELSGNALPEIRTDEPFFWRKTTNEDVKAAIQGSYLETICEALAKNYRGKAPFSLIFGQAILLMGIAHSISKNGTPKHH